MVTWNDPPVTASGSVAPSAEALKANKKFDMFDKVNGTEGTRLALQAGKSASAIVAGWKAGEERFKKEREKYLLY